MVLKSVVFEHNLSDGLAHGEDFWNHIGSSFTILVEAEGIPREDQWTDSIIRLAELNEVLQILVLQYVIVEAHLTPVLNVLTNPFVDELVAVLIRVKIASIRWNHVEEAAELLGALFAVTGHEAPLDTRVRLDIMNCHVQQLNYLCEVFERRRQVILVR